MDEAGKLLLLLLLFLKQASFASSFQESVDVCFLLEIVSPSFLFGMAAEEEEEEICGISLGVTNIVVALLFEEEILFNANVPFEKNEATIKSSSACGIGFEGFGSLRIHVERTSVPRGAGEGEET